MNSNSKSLQLSDTANMLDQANRTLDNQPQYWGRNMTNMEKQRHSPYPIPKFKTQINSHQSTAILTTTTNNQSSLSNNHSYPLTCQVYINLSSPLSTQIKSMKTQVNNSTSKFSRKPSRNFNKMTYSRMKNRLNQYAPHTHLNLKVKKDLTTNLETIYILKSTSIK